MHCTAAPSFEVVLKLFAALVGQRYAEAHVKPVVSDFDTFTVGSRGRGDRVLKEEKRKEED